MAHPLIKLDSTGSEVTLWQGLLAAAGFPVAVTGTFDAETKAATMQWQTSKGLTADGVVGNLSWTAMTGVSQAAPDKNAKYGRDAILEAWPKIIAEAVNHEKPEIRALAESTSIPPIGMLQIIGAQAHLESGYGKSQYTNKLTNEKSGVINNWGAVQAGPPPCDPAKGFEATDTNSKGEPYQYCYKKYATPADGAFDMIRQMTIRRPYSWEAMAQGDIDLWATRMRAKDPITGIGLYFEQSVEGRAKGIEQRVASIAAALDEPIRATRGGPPTNAPDVSTDVPIDTDPSTPGIQTPKHSTTIIVLAGLAYLGYKVLKS